MAAKAQGRIRLVRVRRQICTSSQDFSPSHFKSVNKAANFPFLLGKSWASLAASMYICNEQSNMMLGFFSNDLEISTVELHQVTLWAGKCMTRSWILHISKWTGQINRALIPNVLRYIVMSAAAQVLCVYDKKNGYFVSSVIFKKDWNHILLDKFCLWTSYPCKTNASWMYICLSAFEKHIFQNHVSFSEENKSTWKIFRE